MRYIIVFFSFMLAFAQVPEETFLDDYDDSNQVVGETVARITFVEKGTFLTREMGEQGSAIRNMPVSSGDFLETGANSFAELEFIDGSLMQLDNRTKLEFQAINQTYGRESLSIIKLHDGGVFLHVTGVNHDDIDRVIRVDSEAGSAYFQEAGIYHVAKERSSMKLKVFRGFAELSGEEGSVPVYSGEYSTIRGLRQPTASYAFNSFKTNRFERWASSRRPVTDTVSSGYVDKSISSYSRDLDEYGEWRYAEDTTTYVWVPYVETSWRPYSSGFWDYCDGAMTWVSYDPFGWVTHHYGRWGWSTGFGWYWIPGRWYSPAWVSWSSYDNYVGWCPMGYYNRPYYYGRNGSYNTVIINSHHNTWVYVDASHIVNRDRTYVSRNVTYNGPRRITSRNIYVSRDDLRSSAGIRAVIRDPEVRNQRAATHRAIRSGSMVKANDRNDVRRERVAITSRNSGTPAQSRIQTTRTTTRPDENRRAPVRSNNSGRYQPEERRETRGTSQRDSATDQGRGSTRTNPQQSTTAPARVTPPTSSRSGQSGQDSATSSHSNRNSNNSRATQPANRTAPKRDATPPARSQDNATRPPANNSRPAATTAPSRNNSSTRPPASSRNNSAQAPPPSRNNSPTRPPAANRNNSRSAPPPSATRSSSSSSGKNEGAKPTRKKKDD